MLHPKWWHLSRLPDLNGQEADRQDAVLTGRCPETPTETPLDFRSLLVFSVCAYCKQHTGRIDLMAMALKTTNFKSIHQNEYVGAWEQGWPNCLAGGEQDQERDQGWEHVGITKGLWLYIG